jgi:hypothetical protein
MDALVYPRERTLGAITLVLGSIAWLLNVVGTLGIVLIYLLLGFIAYLFAQSGLVSYIKDTAVRLTPQQFPDLHARFLDCCKKLQIETPPEPACWLATASSTRLQRAFSAGTSWCCCPTRSTRWKATPKASISTSATSSGTCA